MRASAASSPKPILCVFAGLAVLLVSYNLFGRPGSAETSLEPSSAAYRPVGLDTDDGPTVSRHIIGAIPQKVPSAAPPTVAAPDAAAAPVAASTATAATVATAGAAATAAPEQGMSFEDISAVRARLTGAPASKAHGALSSQCQLTVDAERRGLLSDLPRLQLSALGTGDCGPLKPALCAAVRGALGGAAEAAEGAPRLLVTTYTAAQAERLCIRSCMTSCMTSCIA